MPHPPFGFIRLIVAPISLSLLGACSLPKVKIPFIGGSRVTADPLVPFNNKSTIGNGQTLRFSVYDGMLSPDQVFSGKGTVDDHGILHIKGLSDIKAGGLTALDTVKKIEAYFRAKSGDGIIHVQLEKIQDTPVVTVVGSVARPAVIQWFTGMNVNNALPYVGGRELKSSGRAVYITRRGVRRLFSNPASGEDIALKPGDILTCSSEL